MAAFISNHPCKVAFCEISRCGDQPEFILNAELPLNRDKTLCIFIVYESLELTDDDYVFILGVTEWARKISGNLDCQNVHAALEKLHRTQCTRPERKQILACIKAYEAGFTGFTIATSDAIQCERSHLFGTTKGICGALVAGSFTFKIND